jgi:hypothetical protein
MVELQARSQRVDAHSRLGLFALVFVLASAIDAISFWVLPRMQLSPTARIAAGLLPIPGDIALIAMALVRIRRLDEFQKRIHFEAVVVAFLATGVAVFVYGCLQQAHAVGPFNANLVWLFMAVAYAIGYYVAVRHYR